MRGAGSSSSSKDGAGPQTEGVSFYETQAPIHGETAPRARDAAFARKITFDGDDGFHAELKRRVQAHLRTSGLSPHGGLSMVLKTLTILIWFASSYALLVFADVNWWQGALLALSLAFAMAGTGFAIQHDANHGAYARRRSVNRLMGFTLDLLGASSYVWHWKHNILHHTYTNVHGADHDINIQPFARLSPDQPRLRAHRLQQFYVWGLYGFLLPKWHLVDDFQNVWQSRIDDNRMPRPRGWDLFQLVVGKLAFFAWALIVPMMFHRWWVVAVFYGATTFVVGFILAIVFQLAHCSDGAAFPSVAAGSDRLSEGWAAHQVRTTVDFARRNRALTWYLGGLNYQVEHHLFPRISHLHYPAISAIVEDVCAQFGVPYLAHEDMGGALSAHWRWLRRMGAPAGALAS
jgi:linoleoyl-CoA desaturase